MTLRERLTSAGPKRILALDGGGIRGALTLGYLEQMERMLRARYSRPELKLCDYFDLIGGTSTGSIIAAGLAIGMNASDVKDLYLELGGKVFKKVPVYRRIRNSFDAQALREELDRTFQNMTLGDQAIKTGLCIIAKRADTNSTWLLINHPDGKYYPDNRGMLLRQVIRASTAAPTYFEPEKVVIGHGQQGVFVDGGVSMANNPALQLFLLATLQGFPFHWPLGEDKLLLVSVGTGVWQTEEGHQTIMKYHLGNWAKRVAEMLMDDANWQAQLMLQYLSKPLKRWEIDGEIGDLEHDLLTPQPALSYLRYNAWLDPIGLQELGLADLVPRLKTLREMSASQARFDLAQIGEAAAARDVHSAHFPAAFDLAF